MDCLEGMKYIRDKSVDMILCDLPYGNMIAEKWDNIIPFDDLWEQYNRIIKDDGIIALTSTQPFTTSLINSNREMFRYCWYWVKSKPNGWQHAKNKPMTKVEEICIFSKYKYGHKSQMKDKRMRYNPQGVKCIGKKKVTNVAHGKGMGARPNQVGKEYVAYTGYPSNLLEYNNVIGKKALHPTQKPVKLMEYLIKTYTKEKDIILDNCMGSGTTAIAALNTDRRFIGFELSKRYYKLSKERVLSHMKELKGM